MGRQRAVITVFFSLLSVVFLAGSFAVIEAVRVAGARAACANAQALGLWSVFSEYENVLLEDYGLFAVDAGYGGEAVSKSGLLTKFTSFLSENENVTADMSGKLPGILMDPWKVSSGQAQVDQYALLTDRGGEYYYQQAVEYMLQTAWSGALGKLKAAYSDSDKIRQAESEYEESRKASEKDMKQLDKDVQSAKEELGMTQPSGQSTDGIVIIADGEEAEKLKKAEEEGKKKNPLDKINALRKKSILELVYGKGKVSQKKLESSSLPSKRSGNKGVLALDTPRGGGTDDLLFREYLLDHFRNCSDRFESEVLNYQLEYIIAGKYTDEANLKKVARQLLFLREGLNYSFLLSDSSCNAQATSLATLIIGWTGKPLLVASMKHALLLAWAYGESLFDIRILFGGGRIPLKKSRETWNVPLDRLIDLEQELKRADRVAAGGSSGLCYEDFLRLLVNMTGMPALRKRSLDLIELNIRALDGMGSFRADNCVVGMTVSTQWDIPSVFGRVPAALIGTDAVSFHTNVSGGFSY